MAGRQRAEQGGGIGKVFGAHLADAGALGQLCGLGGNQALRQHIGLFDVEPEAVRIAQGVIAPHHRIGGKGAPCSADHVERARMRGCPADLVELRAHACVEPLLVLAIERGQPQRAERQARRLMAFPVLDRDQFETAPAKVRNHAARTGKRADRAGRRNARLFLACQKARVQAEFGDGGEKFGTVRSLARGRCGHGLHVGDAQIVEDARIAGQRAERFIARFLRDQSGLGQVAAEAGGHFLVPDRAGRAGRAFVDHHAHRVGADIDDRARQIDDALLAPGRGCLRHERASPSAGKSVGLPIHPLSRRRGTASASRAWPRPEREGLLIKYRWQLKLSASSSPPLTGCIRSY